MKAGNFNINDYINKLYEEAEAGKLTDKEGLIIPDENKKAYNWLKKEYQRAQTEVKVEMKLGSDKFTPGYDMQSKLDSVKEFKPGMYGEVKTSDSETKKEDVKEPKKEPFTKKEETSEKDNKEEKSDKKEENKSEESKTKDKNPNIKNKKALTVNLKTKK